MGGQPLEASVEFGPLGAGQAAAPHGALHAHDVTELGAEAVSLGGGQAAGADADLDAAIQFALAPADRGPDPAAVHPAIAAVPAAMHAVVGLLVMAFAADLGAEGV